MEVSVSAPDDLLKKLVPLTTVNNTMFTDLTLEQRKQEIFNHITASMISLLTLAASPGARKALIDIADNMEEVILKDQPDRQICSESADYALQLLSRLTSISREKQNQPQG